METNVTVFYTPDHLIGDVFFVKNVDSWLDQHRDSYIKAFEFVTDMTGSKAAEEAFDITNNPYRETEREEIAGRNRSLSVGDLVLAGENLYYCDRFGWKKIS